MNAGHDGPEAHQTAWPAVTVVVPVFNGASCIAACIEALLGQDYPGPTPELIVVDNASTDATPMILRQYGDRIKTLRVAQRGSSPARNAGIIRARHELIALTDADCVPRPDWLRELVSASQADPVASFVGGSIRALKPTNAISAFAESLFDQRRAILEDKPPYVITANLLVRRRDMLRFGLFNTAYPRGQDTELAWRAHHVHNARFAYAEQAVVDHVNIKTFVGLIHKGLQHGKGSARLWKDFQPHHRRSVQARLRQTKPFVDTLRETWKLVSRPWRAWNDRGCNDFYAAWFRLARHLSFIHHTLLPQPVAAPQPDQATIVMPLLQQRDEWLELAVLSALCQTVPVAVIVVTSPATPASNRTVLHRIGAAHPRLRVIERPTGAGFADAINLGFHEAITPRVGLLLSDDWLSPETVETCLARDADIVGTARVAYDADGTQVLWQTGSDQARYDSFTDDQSRASYIGHFLLFRRSVFLDAGGVDPTIGLTGADDYDLIWTMLEHGASVSLVPQALYHYRDHDGQRLTMRRQEDQIRDLRKILTKHRVPADEAERLAASKARWYGVPCHVAIKDPDWFRKPAGVEAAGTCDAIADSAAFSAAWGPDLCSLVAQLGSPVVDIQLLTSEAAPGNRRGCWKLQLADGRLFKGRRLESAERAEQLSTLTGLLQDLPVTAVVTRRGDALLEEWSAGPTLDSTPLDLETAQTLGKLLGRLAITATGSPLLEPRLRSTASLLTKLEHALDELAAADVLTQDICRQLLARAHENAPEKLESGLVHLDLQARNVVMAATGPRIIDNELLDVGILDMDLARTWYLWPLSAAAQARFLRGYADSRSPRAFLLHEVFWAIHTLACAAASRRRNGQPIDELPRALERLARGELPRQWLGSADAAVPRTDERIRVAFICDYLAIGGQERICLNLVRGLDRSRFSPYVYAFRGGALAAAFQELGVPLMIGSDRDPLEAQADWTARDAEEKLAYRDTLAAALARDRIDAALVFAWRDGVPAAQAAGVRVLIEKLDGQALLGKIGDKSGFDRVVAESATLRDEMLARRAELGLDEERIEWVFPGIDLSEFDPARFDRVQERKRLGLTDTDLVVGTVSRLIPAKNIKLLLQAFAGLDPAACPGTPRLLIVGPDGGALADLQSRARELGVDERVIFLPATNQVASVMSVMDVFGMTSLHPEGLPTVILEAMAMGLPILTTGTGSIPEVMDGNGFLLPGFGPEGLANRLQRLLRDTSLRQTMGQRSRVLASRFALRHSIGRYEEMIFGCLAEKPHRPS
jgi:glycosyltransferase involved in cell wall biosynthesis